MEKLSQVADKFESASVPGLLRTAPDISSHLEHFDAMFAVEDDGKTFAIVPTPGADEECDAAQAAIDDIEERLQDLLEEAKSTLKCDVKFWHSAQGNKEIYQIEVPAKIKVRSDWTKCGSTKVGTSRII